MEVREEITTPGSTVMLDSIPGERKPPTVVPTHRKISRAFDPVERVTFIKHENFLENYQTA